MIGKLIVLVLSLLTSGHYWAGVVTGAVIGAATLKVWLTDVIAAGKQAFAKADL